MKKFLFVSILMLVLSSLSYAAPDVGKVKEREKTEFHSCQGIQFIAIATPTDAVVIYELASVTIGSIATSNVANAASIANRKFVSESIRKPKTTDVAGISRWVHYERIFHVPLSKPDINRQSQRKEYLLRVFRC